MRLFAKEVIPNIHPYFYPHLILSNIMAKWHYVQDVKKEKAEAFCENSMKNNDNLIYRVATARSNNPGMVAVYYREKDPES